jgi:hypothetical protein
MCEEDESQMRESTDMRGTVTLELTDAAGTVVHRQQRRNRIVKSGRRLVAERFAGVPTGIPPSQVSHVAVGSDGTAATDDNSQLGNQRGGRNPITQIGYIDIEEKPPGSVETIKRTRASLSAVFDFNEANGPDPLREAGVFTAATGGVMYNRVTFDPVTKTNAFKLTVLWDIVF